MRAVIRFVAVVLFATLLCFTSTKSFGQCASLLTMTADPVLPAGGYAPGTTVTFTLNIGQYTQVASNWLHGVTVDFGSGWDSSSFSVVQAPYSCSGAGYWAYYNSINAEGSGLTLGPGFFFDFDNPFTPADSDPGNNFGDENATGFCNWNFIFQITTDSFASAVEPNGSVVVYGDGSSGMWNNSLCGGDYHDINGLVESLGCNASFSVTGSPYANWPMTFEQTPFSMDWDSVHWWTPDSTFGGFEITQTFDTPGFHSVCLAVYDSACADTLCADVEIQANPFPFNASTKVFGFLFYDSNLNGTKEVGEPGVQIPLRLDTTDLLAYPTADNGRFTFYATQGIHDIMPLDTSLFHLTTLPFNPVLFVAGVNFLGDVGIVADTVFTKAELLNGYVDLSCDSVSTLGIGLRNMGSTVLNGTVKLLFKNNGIAFPAASADTTVMFSNDTILVSISDLKPFAYKSINLTANVSLANGDSVQWETWWNVTDGTNTIGDSKTYVKTVDCSNDLVEKRVIPQNATAENYTLRNTPLTYTIGFQHNIEDSARKVVVVDTLSSYLNEASLFVADAPYPYETMREGNVLKVALPDVYLYGLNSGYLVFNINHDEGIPHNTAIHNTAHVTTDALTEVETNNALVTIVDSLLLQVYTMSNGVTLSLQPNPASDFILITADEPINALVEVYDALGKSKLTVRSTPSSNQIQLDVSTLSAGIYTCRVSVDSEFQLFKFVKQ